MKQKLKFTAFFLIAAFVFTSCKKVKEDAPPIYPPGANNKPPVANAGNDLFITILSCYDKTASIELDGKGSVDPENNIVSYSWTTLYGLPGYILISPASLKSGVEKLLQGLYAFELTVTDAGGLFSKDTVLVTINPNSGTPKEYDFDISFTTGFTFYNNHNDPYEDPTEYYYDYTWFRAKVVFEPFGEFNIGVFEYTDSTALSDKVYSSTLQIRTTKANSYLYLDGELTGVNFKKLIREGGGSFTGSLKVYWGSAEYCDLNIFLNLPPLTVTGSLNVSTGTVSLRIKGKVYF